jgi:hypothetical protein
VRSLYDLLPVLCYPCIDNGDAVRSKVSYARNANGASPMVKMAETTSTTAAGRSSVCRTGSLSSYALGRVWVAMLESRSTESHQISKHTTTPPPARNSTCRRPRRRGDRRPSTVIGSSRQVACMVPTIRSRSPRTPFSSRQLFLAITRYGRLHWRTANLCVRLK